MRMFAATGTQLNGVHAMRNFAELRTFMADVYVCRLAKTELEAAGDEAGWASIRRKRDEVTDAHANELALPHMYSVFS